MCKIWYSISQTVSDLGNIYDRSIRAFAVKPRAFGAPLCGFGLDGSARSSKLLPVPRFPAGNGEPSFADRCLTGGVLIFSTDVVHIKT